MSKIEITNEQEKIAGIAKALGHPTRVAIMYFLAHRQQCYFGDIAEVLHIAKPTVSQHLSELKKAELIIGEVEAPKVRYCINTERWKEARKLYATLFDLCQCNCGEECHCHDN